MLRLATGTGRTRTRRAVLEARPVPEARPVTEAADVSGPRDPTPAPWVPATRVPAGPRAIVSGARVFAGLAALVLLARRRSA